MPKQEAGTQAELLPPQESKDTGPKSLVGKIAEACDAVGGIEKKGTNQKQGYKYLKAADVAKAIRHEFFSRGVLITFDDKDFTLIRTIATNSGGQMGEFLLKTEITFHDADSEAILGPYGAFGAAMDTGDKAIWKCSTGALKYALRRIGLIPDEKDDPESDKEVDAETLPPPRMSPELEAKAEGQVRISAFQVKNFWEGVKKTGKTNEQVAEFLKNLNNYVQVEQIQRQHWNDAIKWAIFKGKSEPVKPQLHGDAMSKCAKHGEYRGEGNCPKCEPISDDDVPF